MVSATPWRGRGDFSTPIYPGVFVGATPLLDTRAKHRAPLRGASRRPGALPPADPAGAKPRRDHRLLARWSRHEVPMTPGNDDAYKVYDPDRVSHRQPNLLSTTPSGVVGISPHRAIPGSSSGLAPLLDTRAKHRAPLRGALSVRGREQKKVDSRQDVIPVGSRPYLTQMRLTGRQSSGIISSKGVSSSGAGAVAFAVSRRRLVSRSALLATMKPLRAAKPVPAGMR